MITYTHMHIYIQGKYMNVHMCACVYNVGVYKYV